MQHAEQLIRSVSRRVFVGAFIRRFIITLTAGAGAIVALRLCERLFALSIDWPLAGGIALGAAALGALIWAFVTRPDRSDIARAIDERGNLRESLSTALAIRAMQDPWSRATVDRAEQVARETNAKPLFPITAPDWSYVPLLLVGAFFLLGLLPQQNLLAEEGRVVEQQTDEPLVIEAKNDVEKSKESLGKAFDKLGDEDMKKQLDELTSPEQSDPNEIRRSAMKKMTSLKDRLERMKDDETAAALDELKNRLAKLDPNKNGMSDLDALKKALQKGDFNKAKQSLHDLQNKLDNGDLTEEQKKKLAEQLEELAKQLEQLAQDREALEKMLREAGLDPSLADDPQALEEALKNAENLSEQQKQKLMSKSRAGNAASEQCRSMAKACQGMAKASEGGGKMGSELAEFGDQLDAAQSQEAKQKAAAQAMRELEKQLSEMGGKCEGSQCKNGQCSGMCMGTCQKPGPGVGNRGQGGGFADEDEVESTKEAMKADSHDHGGPIVGSKMVQGGQVRGEARQEFSQTVATSSDDATQAIESMQIPQEYHDLIKRYYGGLEGAGAGSEGGAEQSASDPSDG